MSISETTGIAATGVIFTGATTTPIPLSQLFTTYNLTISANAFDAEITTDDGSYIIGPNGQTYGYGDLTSDIPLNELSETYFVPSGSAGEATLIAFNADSDTSGTSLYSYPAVSVVLGTGIMQGFDYPYALDPTQIAAIKPAGYQFVVRYYSTDGSETSLSATELSDLENAGLKVCTIFENKSEAGNYSNGTADALAAIEQATAAGQPGTSAIYFAIDDNTTSPSSVESYFSEILSVFNNSTDNPLGYKVGAYGSGASCAAAVSVGASYAWLNAASYGWSNTTPPFQSWQTAQVAVDEHGSTIPYTNLDPNGELPVDALGYHQIVVGNAIFGIDIDVAQIGVNFGAFGSSTTSAGTTPPVFVNDNPVPLSVGETATITSADLAVSDSGFTDSQLTYTVVTAPSYGTLLLNGSPTSSFTQAEIDDGLVSYHENGTVVSSDYFVFKASNSAGQTTANTPFQLQIATPNNTPPTFVDDTGLSIAIDGAETITSDMLKVTDADYSDTQLTYTVVQAPSYGTVLLNGSPTSSFTQAEIDDGLVSYAEFASGTSSDYFSVYATDPGGNRTTSAAVFEIQINAAGTNVGNGETLDVSAGHTSTGITVENGGTINVLSGGRTNYTIIDGGLDFVNSGGIETGATVNDQGRQYVSGGTASGTTVNSASWQVTESGGTAIATTANSGSYITVYLGGTAIDTAVNGGGDDVYAGGVALGDVVNSGGYYYVGSAGTAIDPTIDGGRLELDYGGTIADSVTFSNQAGELRIATLTMPSAVISGFAAGDIIDLSELYFTSSGTTQLLSDNILKISEDGSSYNLQFDPSQNFGGEQFNLVTDGYGTEIELGPAAVVGSGQTFNLLSGQTTSGTTIASGGVLNVSAGANSNEIQVYGVQTVLSGGAFVSTTINNGGVQFDWGAANLTVVSGGGSQFVWSSGNASGTIVNDGQDFIYGTASATTLDSGGIEVIRGGTSIGGTVHDDGVQIVETGGVASGTLIADPGLLIISAGTAVSATVSGGEEDVQSGGTALDTTVVSALSGGTAFSGLELVESGGTALDTSLAAGGVELILSGGNASNVTISTGGIAEVLAGATVSGALTFVRSNGTLDIGGSSSALSALLSGLVISGLSDGDVIDLTNVGSAAGATVSASNNELILTIDETGYELKLGTSISSDINIALASDGYTGTDIIFGTTGSAGGTIPNHSTYYVSSTALDEVIDSGGTMIITSGGVAYDTTVSKGGVLVLETGGTEVGLVNDGLILGEGGVISAGTGTIVNNGILDPGGGQLPLADPAIASPVDVTLAFSANTMPSLINYVGLSNIALLGNYIASMFASAEGEVGIPTAQAMHSQAILAPPHPA